MLEAEETKERSPLTEGWLKALREVGVVLMIAKSTQPSRSAGYTKQRHALEVSRYGAQDDNALEGKRMVFTARLWSI